MRIANQHNQHSQKPSPGRESIPRVLASWWGPASDGISIFKHIFHKFCDSDYLFWYYFLICCVHCCSSSIFHPFCKCFNSIIISFSILIWFNRSLWVIILFICQNGLWVYFYPSKIPQFNIFRQTVLFNFCCWTF